MNVVYSSLKFLSYHEQLAALRERRLVAPVHIRIKPMNYCNHNCWYCAYRYDNLSLGEGMDTADQLPRDKMFEIVEDVIEMGVKAVTFSGGGNSPKHASRWLH
jgi:2-iminoacetate synthase ThiH